MAADRARREAAEQRQQQLEQQMAHQQGLLEQQGQMMRWMTQQMLINSQPGTLPTPPFAFSWVMIKCLIVQCSQFSILPYCLMLTISNAADGQCDAAAWWVRGWIEQPGAAVFHRQQSVGRPEAESESSRFVFLYLSNLAMPSHL